MAFESRARDSTPKRRFKSTPRVSKKIKTPNKFLTSVSCWKDDEILICGTHESTENEEISLYSLDGDLLRAFSNKGTGEPWDMTLTRSREIVYTDPIDRTIYMHRLDERNPRTPIVIQDWAPYNICSTSTDDLLVVLVKDDETKLVRFSDSNEGSTEGSTETQSIQFDDNGQPFFSSKPNTKYLTENRNLDICVADLGAHAVVVFNVEGTLRFRYTGSSSDTKKPFCPVGITTDSQSNILTTDTNNNRIYILNQNGDFLRCLKKLGIDCPKGLCVDSKDNIFVAEWYSGKVKKIKYYKSK